MLLPKYNLLDNDINNEQMYFNKMADELIRYTRIRSYMFQPQAFLSFSNLEYNLRENEIILIESLLQEYFNGLIPEQINPFVKYNNYDTILPVKTLPYDNKVKLNEEILSAKAKPLPKPKQLDINILEQIQELEKPISSEKFSDSTSTVEIKTKPMKPPAPVITTDCKTKQLLKIKSEEWKKCFPSNYKEIKYDNKTHTCGYQLIIDIIHHFKQNVLTIQQIRDELLQEYKKYLPKIKIK